MSAPVVEVEALFTGEVPLAHAYVFRPQRGNRLTHLAAVLRPGGDIVRAACLAFVVRHPSGGTILVDTGFHPDAAVSARKEFGLLLAPVFGRLRPARVPYEQQLREHGADPAEVRRVVMTHLHGDHTSGMRLLPQATFVCARTEWAAARRRDAVRGGYVGHHLPAQERMELLDLDEATEPHGPFRATLDLLGDGSVRLVATPGHTEGHLSVLLRTARRPVLLVGDAVYTLRNLREERLPLLTAADDAYLRSVREIAAFAETAPDALLVPSHDPDAWRALAGCPPVG